MAAARVSNGPLKMAALTAGSTADRERMRTWALADTVDIFGAT